MPEEYKWRDAFTKRHHRACVVTQHAGKTCHISVGHLIRNKLFEPNVDS